jgi:hyperosmotically inducible periplasmic protein
MRLRRLPGSVVTLLAFGMIVGCSNTPRKSPDVSGQIRNSLDQAGLKDVSISQDRDKGVVTLSGTTASEADKGQAESIAKSIANSEVISNQIAVRPANDDTAKTVDSDTDKAIEKNLDAALVRHKLNHEVKYDVKNGVVTLTGKVVSQSQRKGAEKIASTVPNVKQVVNELQLKGEKNTQKASSAS